jgi:pyruvate formate lyase activating enzyme
VTVAHWTDAAFVRALSPEGRVLRIERFAIHDGPGIRTTVFLKGCPLRCAWCHTPESQSLGLEFLPHGDRCLRCGTCTSICPQQGALVAASGGPIATDACDMCGKCTEACPTDAREMVGQPMSVGALLAEIERDRIFYDESGGGVTFSGGEPLMQPAFLLDMVHACRASGIHVAVDTCGLVDTEALLDAAHAVDLFLYDVKIMDEERHRAFTGASNVRILQNLERLVAVHDNILVRFPLVPGVNEDDENVLALGAFLASLRLTRVDVLPYHRAGIAKYDRLNKPYTLTATQPPSRELQDHVVRLLEGCGLIVRPGGISS